MIQVQYKRHTRTTKDETSTIQVLDNMIQVQYKQYTSTTKHDTCTLQTEKSPEFIVNSGLFCVYKVQLSCFVVLVYCLYCTCILFVLY